MRKMMKNLLISAAAIAAIGFATAAFGQAAQTDQSFTSADTDLDGFVSMTELQVLFPDYDQAKFDLLDTDMSGGLTAEEYASLEGGVESLVDTKG
jgi:hypothetical protein